MTWKKIYKLNYTVILAIVALSSCLLTIIGIGLTFNVRCMSFDNKFFFVFLEEFLARK